MNFDPTEDDLRTVESYLSLQPEETMSDDRREFLTRIWERVASTTLSRHFYREMSFEVHRMMSPSPSVTRKEGYP